MQGTMVKKIRRYASPKVKDVFKKDYLILNGLVVAVARVINRTVNAKELFGHRFIVRTKTLRFGTNQERC